MPMRLPYGVFVLTCRPMSFEMSPVISLSGSVVLLNFKVCTVLHFADSLSHVGVVFCCWVGVPPQ